MDTWTFNKAAAAVLLSLLVLFGGNTAVTILYPEGGPGEYQVVEVEEEAETQVAEGEAQQEGEAAESGAEPLPVLLANADPAAGERVARECSACHVFEEGGPNRVGPNLYGAVGREVASVEGFSYSNALKEYGGEWTYERLDCFLENPSECVPGTSMGYAGVKDPQRRANLIAYLATLGEAPPFPEAEETAEGGADARGEDGEAEAPEAAEEAGADDQEEAAGEPQSGQEQQPTDQQADQQQAAGQQDRADTEADSADQQPAPAEEEEAAGAAQPSEGEGQAETGEAAEGEAAQGDGAQGDDAEGEAASGKSETEGGDEQLAALFADASAAEGENAVRACSACHTFEEGGANRVGPNLHGIVGREVASVEGFRYSQALQEYGGEWTYERLNCFLKNPSECVPGNKMTYAGVKDDDKRADIIAYLASLGEAPPLPGAESDTGQAEQKTDAARNADDDPETRAASLEKPGTRQ